MNETIDWMGRLVDELAAHQAAHGCAASQRKINKPKQFPFCFGVDCCGGVNLFLSSSNFSSFSSLLNAAKAASIQWKREDKID